MSTQTISSCPAQPSVQANLTRRTIARPQAASRPASTAKRPTFLDLLMRALSAVAV